MHRRFAITASAAALALFSLTGPAQAQPQSRTPAPERSCFFQQNVSSFSAPDDHTVYLRVGVSEYYKLDLMGPCHNLDFAQGVELRNPGGGAICSPLDAEVIVRLSGAATDRCPIQGLRKLAPDEVKLLGKNKP